MARQVGEYGPRSALRQPLEPALDAVPRWPLVRVVVRDAPAPTALDLEQPGQLDRTDRLAPTRVVDLDGHPLAVGPTQLEEHLGRPVQADLGRGAPQLALADVTQMDLDVVATGHPQGQLQPLGPAEGHRRGAPDRRHHGQLDAVHAGHAGPRRGLDGVVQAGPAPVPFVADHQHRDRPLLERAAAVDEGAGPPSAIEHGRGAGEHHEALGAVVAQGGQRHGHHLRLLDRGRVEGEAVVGIGLAAEGLGVVGGVVQQQEAVVGRDHEGLDPGVTQQAPRRSQLLQGDLEAGQPGATLAGRVQLLAVDQHDARLGHGLLEADGVALEHVGQAQQGRGPATDHVLHHPLTALGVLDLERLGLEAAERVVADHRFEPAGRDHRRQHVHADRGHRRQLGQPQLEIHPGARLALDLPGQGAGHLVAQGVDQEQGHRPAVLGQRTHDLTKQVALLQRLGGQEAGALGQGGKRPGQVVGPGAVAGPQVIEPLAQHAVMGKPGLQQPGAELLQLPVGAVHDPAGGRVTVDGQLQGVGVVQQPAGDLDGAPQPGRPGYELPGRASVPPLADPERVGEAVVGPTRHVVPAILVQAVEGRAQQPRLLHPEGIHPPQVLGRTLGELLVQPLLDPVGDPHVVPGGVGPQVNRHALAGLDQRGGQGGQRL